MQFIWHRGEVILPKALTGDRLSELLMRLGQDDRLAGSLHPLLLLMCGHGGDTRRRAAIEVL